ncbi:hypothetical protein [Actinoplanes friuliensis]|uniref:hypothetical protein n=1 Tax=Actinoplanes friuliensis TaxID=196914 RepID=UPI0011DDB491|nr:hypothetical protein [Actinoplanes friuliensis]
MGERRNRVRLCRLGGVVAALFLVLLSMPAAAEAPYPPGISAATIRTATLGAATVAAGGAHSCAVTSLGDLYCWGDDSSGQLGDGREPHGFGTPVRALRGAVQVDAGKAHTCAIDLRGAASCWGDDSAGQLGDGAETDQDSPVKVTGLSGRTLVEITTGARHSCAIDDEGAAWCWGDGSRGQLGAPGVRGSKTPVRVSTGSGMSDPVVDISAGRDATCATTAGGTAFCWGSDAYEQLGTAGHGDRDEPMAVAADGPMRGKIREVGVGGMQACAIDADGLAFCWGTHALGSGTVKPKVEPVAVGVTGTLSTITAGGEHTCGLDGRGQAFCWGEGAGGASRRAVPVGVRTASALRDLDAGDEHSCAFDTRGVVVCWGAGADGQLGTGSTSAAAVPVEVKGLPRPPAAPEGVQVRALDGGLRVFWRPPADMGSGEFLYFWATTADYGSTCTLAVATADGCELVDLENGRQYDVAVVVRTRDGITVSDLVTAAPAAVAPLPSDTPEPRRMAVSVLPGAGGGLPVTGLSPIALTAIGTLLLGGGLAALLVRKR